MKDKEYKDFNSFVKGEYAWFMIIAILAFVAIVIISLLGSSYQEKIEQWESRLGCITFLFALYLWWMQIRREFQFIKDEHIREAKHAEFERKRMLPKRLTVRFVFGGKVVLECKEAMLTDAGDIRAWSQQVGSQMIGGRPLDFFPFVKIEEPILQPDAKSEKQYWLYTAVFTLKTLPIPVKDKEPTPYQNEVDSKLSSGQALYWTPVYHSNGSFQLVDIWSEALTLVG